MQFVYAAHVQVEAQSDRGPTPETGFKQAVGDWAHERLDIGISDWMSGQAEGRNSRAEWSTLDGAAGHLTRLSVSHADTSGPWNWRIVVWLGQENGTSWLRVRIGLDPKSEGIVMDPNISVGAPRFLRSLGEQLRLAIDGHELGSWWQVTERQVASYVAFLESPERRLPVVAITRPTHGTPPIAPEQLAQRLAGIAHVVGVEPAATYGVSDAVTPTRSVFGGAVRLYWPGFRRDSKPYSHPLFMPSGRYLTSDSFIDDLAARLGRSAGLFLGPPPLEGELRRETAAKRAEGARRKQTERLQRQQEVKAKSVGGLTAEEFEVFSKDFEAESSRRAELEEAVAELEIELEEERELRVRQENAHREAWQALASGSAGVQSADNADSAPGRVPETVREAVEIAASRCPDLLFTQSAYESAEESQFNSPTDVLSDLLLLQDVASQWAKGGMNGDFRNAFDGRHSNFRSGISQTAATQYGSDYTISYLGQLVQMGPHLCRGGVGAPPTILRIYWFKDDANKKLVVGHVGRKLRDESNPN
jgi:hypothetical protein